MGRLVGAVVLGYVILVIVVFAGLSAAFVALGADRAFRPGVYDASGLWIVTSMVVGFGAAALAGWVARAVARTGTGPRALAVAVVVLGVAMALPALFGTPEAVAPRTEMLGPLEAMGAAQTPVWVMLVNPLIGALGVLVGGRALGASTAHGAP